MVSVATFTSGREQPIWLATHEQPAFSPLTGNTSVDACVIGAGLAGLSTAYRLAREGLSVIVLEDGFVGSGKTGRTTAHLSNVIDDRYSEIERIHGKVGARLAATSHSAAIDRIEQTIQEETIACDFRRVDGYLILSSEHRSELLREEQTAAQEAGLQNVELLDRCPLLKVVSQPCLRFRHQAQFHVLQYLSGLANALIKRGGQVFTQTHAIEIRGGRHAYVRTASGLKVEAQSPRSVTSQCATLKRKSKRKRIFISRTFSGSTLI